MFRLLLRLLFPMCYTEIRIMDCQPSLKLKIHEGYLSGNK